MSAPSVFAFDDRRRLQTIAVVAPPDSNRPFWRRSPARPTRRFANFIVLYDAARAPMRRRRPPPLPPPSPPPPPLLLLLLLLLRSCRSTYHAKFADALGAAGQSPIAGDRHWSSDRRRGSGRRANGSALPHVCSRLRRGSGDSDDDDDDDGRVASRRSDRL